MRKAQYAMRSVCLSVLLCLPALSAQTRSTETALRQEVLSVLVRELQQDYPAYSNDLMGQLASATRGNREALRDSLEKLLDAADRHRDHKTDTWKRWLQLRGQLSERKAGRLLRHSVAMARKIIVSIPRRR